VVLFEDDRLPGERGAGIMDAGDYPGEQVIRDHERNMATLLRIPGVLGVAFGFKETAGEVMPTLAYRVHVSGKRPAGDLAADERIPEEIGGFPTDVLTGDPGDVAPAKGPTLVPGKQIKRHVPGEGTGYGTLGLLVRKNSVRFLLTNQHVLHDDSWLAPDTLDVYSPERKTCSELQCNSPVARIVQQHPLGVDDFIDFENKKFHVDATIAEIAAGVNGSNVVDGIGRLDQGLRDISGVPLTGSSPTPVEVINVAKRGATTGLTKGTVTAMFRMTKVGTPEQWITSWEFTVRPDPVHSHEYDEKFELAPDQNEQEIRNYYQGKPLIAEITPNGARRTLRLRGRTFTLSGDSGSVVVDTQRKIVGLLWATPFIDIKTVKDPFTVRLPSGEGTILYIRPVFSKMGLSETDGVIPPGSPAAGPVMTDVELTPPPQVMRDLAAALSRLPAGRQLIELVRRYGERIAHLVHEHRRVKVAWHRAQGPAFATAALRAHQRGDGVLPKEINGVTLTESLRRMREVLLREGDEQLRDAVLAHGDDIVALSEHASSIPALLSALEQADGRCFRS
jgi:hypothetical protein